MFTWEDDVKINLKLVKAGIIELQKGKQAYSCTNNKKQK